MAIVKRRFRMGVGVRNEKGLHGSFWNSVFEIAPEESFREVRGAWEGAGGKDGALGEVLGVLETRATLNAASVRMACRGFKWWPTGWVNESETQVGFGVSAKELSDDLRAGARLSEIWKDASREARGLGVSIGNWKLPPGAAKAGSWEVFEAGETLNAAPCSGWAIWMEEGRGWMDDRKRPAKRCSEARLFESQAAAARTAKAARFGDGRERGPCALVRVDLEARSVHSRHESESAPLTGLDGAMARRDEEELERALSEGLEVALCEGDVSEFTGWATWGAYPSGEEGEEGRAGFLNIRGGFGPLSGADLSPTPERARSKGNWRAVSWAVVGILARPVEVSERIGAAEAAEVEEAVLRGRRAADGMAAELARMDAGSAPKRTQASSI